MRAPQPLAGVLTLSDRELVLGHAERLQPRLEHVVVVRDVAQRGDARDVVEVAVEWAGQRTVIIRI